MLKKTFLYASAVALLASCANDDALWQTESGPAKQQITIQPKDDLTFGYNSIITETDSLATVSIPLNTDVPVTVSLRDGYAPLQCVNVDGKYYLQVANPAQAQTGIDKVTLSVKGHPELTKSFLFTVRQSYATTSSRAAAANVDAVTQRFANVFSFGQYLWRTSADEHPSYPMFDPKRLYNPDDENIPNMIVKDEISGSTSELVKVTGSSLQEHSKNLSISVGLSGIPIAKAIIGGSYSFSKKSVSKNYYEYLTKTDLRKCAAASLSLEMRSIQPNSEKWKNYISKDLDEALNCPGSDIYKMYAETDSGAYKLLEEFGSHLVTYCELGAKATLEFRKKQEMAQTSIEHAASASFSIKKDNEGGSTLDWSDVIVAKYLASKRTSGTVNFNMSSSDYAEQTEAEWYTKIVGGNANVVKDMENASDWNATDDPEKWVPVAYRKKMGDKFVDDGLKAIYEFCQDTESERYKTLKHVLEDEDGNGYCPFVNYIFNTYGIRPNNEETEWVLGGVYVEDKEDSKDYHPSPIKRQLSNSTKEVIFYPFNDLALQKNMCLDTQTDKFGDTHDDGHYWYYAMVMRDDYEGLEDIKLVNKDQVDKFKKDGYCVCMSPNATSFADGWWCNEQNKYVLMEKPIKKDNPTKVKPLTGFSLEIWRHRDRSGDNYEVLAVSGGTGKLSNNSFNDRYEHYWVKPPKGPGEPSPVNWVMNQDNEIKPVYFLSWTIQPWYLFLKTTNVPIRPEDHYIDKPGDMRDMK